MGLLNLLLQTVHSWIASYLTSCAFYIEDCACQYLGVFIEVSRCHSFSSYVDGCKVRRFWVQSGQEGHGHALKKPRVSRDIRISGYSQQAGRSDGDDGPSSDH